MVGLVLASEVWFQILVWKYLQIGLPRRKTIVVREIVLGKPASEWCQVWVLYPLLLEIELHQSPKAQEHSLVKKSQHSVVTENQSPTSELCTPVPGQGCLISTSVPKEQNCWDGGQSPYCGCWMLQPWDQMQGDLQISHCELFCIAKLFRKWIEEPLSTHFNLYALSIHVFYKMYTCTNVCTCTFHRTSTQTFLTLASEY